MPGQGQRQRRRFWRDASEGYARTRCTGHSGSHEAHADPSRHKSDERRHRRGLLHDARADAFSLEQGDDPVVDVGPDAAWRDQKRHAVQRLDGHGFQSRQSVRRWQRETERLVRQIGRAQVRCLERRVQHAQVEFTGGERPLQGRRIHLGQIHLHRRKAQAELLYRFGKAPVEGDHGEAKAEAPAFPACRGQRIAAGTVTKFHRLPRRSDEGGASRCKGHAASVAEEERDANLLLQCADALTEGWLGQVQPLRCTAKVKILRDGDDAGKGA